MNNKKKIFYSNQTFKKLNIKIVKKNQTKILFKKDRLFSSKKYFDNLIKKKKNKFNKQ